MGFNKYLFETGDSLSKFASFQETETYSDLDEKSMKGLRADLWSQLAEYQERLYAESKQSLLIVLQAMDAAGKDSTIAKLTSRLNAQGCHVHSFKGPTKQELSHDFLWRVHDKAPAEGEITIFNRSHYEDVLIVKVHGWADEEKIKARYEHINNFESLLEDRGTKVVKFMLNISPEYQMERFVRRLDRPDKNWKFNPGDLDERKLWPAYMEAFELAMNATSKKNAPWYVVPAENRLLRDVMIASVTLEALKEMNPQFPEPDFDPAVFNSGSIS
jgi:PPK2 family polyphosphate:nucleotide phosphotransferase